ncbi:hypothetical protein DIURU_003963 [Diutina rugosa]|uniref:SAGA complex subunit Spt7 n=1 Tax=Diutina rugosa TaxID=5481 RepID=A0A642UR40_DIURU|nr:uncharacterized protein DIURU_003963 [Diutina rugosa]KAA8900147.1 hypothetical protein DIURU_003963 [Diutina rugosa]
MERLGTFEASNEENLFLLAKKLNSKRFFDNFVTETQLKILHHIVALDDPVVWQNFISGNCYLQIENKTDSVAVEDGTTMIRALAMHVRYLLWEKAVDYYYESQTMGDLEEVSEDFALLNDLDDTTNSAKRPAEPVAPAPKPAREEEDDYDDDDDDDDDGDQPMDSAPDTQGDHKSDIEYNDDGQVLIKVPASELAPKESVHESHPEVADSEPAAAEPGQNQSPAEIHGTLDEQVKLKEFNKVYHNFEFDRDTLIKRRKLERSDKKLQEQKEKEEPQKDGAVPINLGAATSSLQHLIGTIQHRRDDVPLTDFELRTLFMDVRKNRGKWANDERVGQEELYEACEKVILELRGMTEHSTPFLNKVSKREAPNYALIIKKPMDLNTVMKKLKGLQYNSKQEFIDDLMLIWSNCLTYNADPRHYLRAHAIAMQTKTQKLASTIPDITIRNRSEIEKEEEAENERLGTPRTEGGKSQTKGRKRTRADEIKIEETVSIASPGGTPEPEANDADTPIPGGTPAPTDDSTPAATKLPTKTVNSPPPTASTAAGTPAPAVASDDEEDEDQHENNEANLIEETGEDYFDPQSQAWRTITAKSRANYCSQRAELFQENGHLEADADAIIRQSSDTKNFNHYLDNKTVLSKSDNLLENDEPYLLEYDITGGLPGLKFGGVDQEDQDEQENKLADIYLQRADGNADNIKSGFVLPLDKGLNKVYFENISEIQEIRKICFKISLIRQMQTQQFVHHTQMKQPEIEYLKEVDVDAASKLPTRENFSRDVQYAVLRRNVAKIAMQTGFETTEPSAINTLTQVAERYMQNLIKSMKMHSESFSRNKMSAREILLSSLLENGVDKPDDLYTYVQERIIKQQDKLKSLRGKLTNFLKDLLRPGLENFSERSFEDNSEQFMTGDFSSDLGDDFFGFKELGLDKEFKMLSSSIPIYLLSSRLHTQYNQTGVASKRNKYEDLTRFEPPMMVAADIDGQVEVLKPFYNKLYEKSKAHYIKQQKKKGESAELPENGMLEMIEDDELPQKQRNIRPRLPPTGKIGGVKKRLISNAYFIPTEDDVPKDTIDPAEFAAIAE